MSKRLLEQLAQTRSRFQTSCGGLVLLGGGWYTDPALGLLRCRLIWFPAASYGLLQTVETSNMSQRYSKCFPAGHSW
eukprot:2036272-Amphidinium_carterae.1